jgi:hypothetical protein
MRRKGRGRFLKNVRRSGKADKLAVYPELTHRFGEGETWHEAPGGKAFSYSIIGAQTKKLSRQEPILNTLGAFLSP